VLVDQIVEITLIEDQIAKAQGMGKRRTDYDERILDWHFRHNGLDSASAHAIGILGEDAFEGYLINLGLRAGQDYIRCNFLVSKHNDIQQDFVVQGTTIGVKTAIRESREKIFRFDSFLYPAKSRETESRRILGYPEFVIQAAVSLSALRCWLIGFVAREAIRSSPITEIHKEPAHEISIFQFRPMNELMGALEVSKRSHEPINLSDFWDLDFWPEVLA